MTTEVDGADSASLRRGLDAATGHADVEQADIGALAQHGAHRPVAVGGLRRPR